MGPCTFGGGVYATCPHVKYPMEAPLLFNVCIDPSESIPLSGYTNGTVNGLVKQTKNKQTNESHHPTGILLTREDLDEGATPPRCHGCTGVQGTAVSGAPDVALCRPFDADCGAFRRLMLTVVRSRSRYDVIAFKQAGTLQRRFWLRAVQSVAKRPDRRQAYRC